MHTVCLAIGANVGNKKKSIHQAVLLLQEKITHIVLAPLYETKPWGFAGQGNFLNTALYGETELSVDELLVFVKDIEQKVGRVKRFTNGPREIDIDIIFYDDLVSSAPNLIIPHPRMHERDFVLQPLVDIVPDMVHPLLRKTVRQLLNALPEGNRFVIKQVKPD